MKALMFVYCVNITYVFIYVVHHLCRYTYYEAIMFMYILCIHKCM